MKIAQYVETFGYVGMFNTMNFASYICLYLISPFMQHPVDHVDKTFVKCSVFYFEFSSIFLFDKC